MADSIRKQHSKLIIEVCVDSVESAMASVQCSLRALRNHSDDQPCTIYSAVRGGADRLELCGNLGLGGGTTPSIGLLKSVKKAISNVPIMAIVRPRTGDFVYSEEELQVMLEDISVFKEHGVQGVVFGALTPAGKVNHDQIGRLVARAVPLEICFHRAFDMVVDPKNAWNTLCKMPGITRVLTSGHCRHASAPEALCNLSQMLDSDTLGVLPGSGINISTIPSLCNALIPHGLKEIHLSGGKWFDGRSDYRPEGMGMGVGGAGEWGVWRTDEESVRKVRDFVDKVVT